MSQSPTPNLYTIKQFAEKHPAFKAGGLRWQIFNEKNNGLKETKAVIRLGRKILIDADRYFEWVYNQNQGEK